MDGKLEDHHSRVWRALDDLARARGVSPSALAKAAGLDATAFNPSKRVASGGRLRWPGMETLIKVCQSSGVALHDLVILIEGQQTNIQLSALSQAQFLNDGEPAGCEWRAISLLDVYQPHSMAAHGAIALEIDHIELEPILRRGDVAVLGEPDAPQAKSRILSAWKTGEVSFCDVISISRTSIQMRPLSQRRTQLTRTLDQLSWARPLLWTRCATP